MYHKLNECLNVFIMKLEKVLNFFFGVFMLKITIYLESGYWIRYIFALYYHAFTHHYVKKMVFWLDIFVIVFQT